MAYYHSTHFDKSNGGLMDNITLKVLDPRGEIETAPLTRAVPRLTELDRKKIGLYWNGKPDGDFFWNRIEELLKEKQPDTEIVRLNGPGDLGADFAESVSSRVDTLMYGVGD
jgi:hypothetical protein